METNNNNIDININNIDIIDSNNINNSNNSNNNNTTTNTSTTTKNKNYHETINYLTSISKNLENEITAAYKNSIDYIKKKKDNGIDVNENENENENDEEEMNLFKPSSENIENATQQPNQQTTPTTTPPTNLTGSVSKATAKATSTFLSFFKNTNSSHIKIPPPVTTTTTSTTTTSTTSSTTTNNDNNNTTNTTTNTTVVEENTNTNKNTQISEQANSSRMAIITELLNKLFNKKYSTVDLLMGLILLNSYFKENVNREFEFQKEKEKLKLGYRYAKFGSAAYGRKMYYGLMKEGFTKIKSVMGSDKSNIKIISEHCGVDIKDILTSKWYSTKYSPGHYLVLDHEMKSLVFAIRGTFNYLDVISDLVAKSYHYGDGAAHLGILLCAHMKMKEMYNEIKRILDLHKGYKLVVTGHSLGAGVASLFTILFNDSSPEIPIHCYAYGVPCILSLEAASHPKVQSLITSYCMNDDIICRLSFNSLFYLREVIDAILVQSNSKLNQFFHMASAGNNLGDKWTNKISKMLNVSPTINLSNVQHSISGEISLYPPGELYLLAKHQKGSYICGLVSHHSFEKIIVSHNMFTDHMPQEYEKGFVSSLENIDKDQFKSVDQIQIKLETSHSTTVTTINNNNTTTSTITTTSNVNNIIISTEDKIEI